LSGVVVGVTGSDGSGPAVRWASSEAALRGLDLTLVHAWGEPVDLSVELAADCLPGLSGGATACAIHGRPEAVLLAQRADLLVLGSRMGAHHVSHLTRSCMHHAASAVVVVPDHERAPVGRVVVGVCGTDASRAALRWAADAAALRGADLVVVHAWQVHASSPLTALMPARAQPRQQEEAIERVRAWVREVLGRDDVEMHAPHGGPLDGLLAHSEDADLIVLGRHTHAGIGRLLHGALGDDLGGLAPCPVAAIPGGDQLDAAHIV
jgi:nucleotide-binding universal stress UspA family protein